MQNDLLEPSQLKPHPDNIYWTMPKSWGVWKLPPGAGGKKYRYGINPIRGMELEKEYGRASLMALYSSQVSARLRAVELNAGLPK